jgi:hypothetical protein
MNVLTLKLVDKVFVDPNNFVELTYCSAANKDPLIRLVTAKCHYYFEVEQLNNNTISAFGTRRNCDIHILLNTKEGTGILTYVS